MTTASTRLGLLKPLCELCGKIASPHHGDSHRGGFVQVRNPGFGSDESLPVWACEACVSSQKGLFPQSLTPQQKQTLDRVRGIQGCVADREVASSLNLVQSLSVGDSIRLGVDELAAWHLLSSVRGVGPKATAAIYAAGLKPAQLIEDPGLYPLKGKRAKDVVTAMRALTEKEKASACEFAKSQLQRAQKLGATIISYDDVDYPPLVRDSNNPIPILWVRGNKSILRSRKAVACVGSRNIRTPYSELQEAFADVAVQEGFVITSGFAIGADSVGHRRALERGGSTICVMPCGVDLVFPPENRKLWRELMDSDQAVFLSEFALGRRAASLTLRKRNKLIVAAARGILVGQTSKSGGAMNAFRFGLEQKKPVATFEPDGTDDTSGNKEIMESTRGNTSVLPATPGIEDYRRWLHELSFLT